jgi:peptidoglycan/xylan/chitin deacetylase (PgdA/CDA1 family)
MKTSLRIRILLLSAAATVAASFLVPLGASGSVAESPPQPAFYTYQAPGGASTAGQRVIALTFDDGPGPYTPQVLSILEQYLVPATFFEIGEEVAQNPQYAREAAAAGYPVEDHTWSHPDLATIPLSELATQIDQTQNEIRSVTGETPECVRPPYDAWNSTVLEQVAQRGLLTMSYSIDPRDWTLPGVQAIVSRVVGAAFPGAVVDMHDGGGPRDETVAALPQIINTLRSEGYSFVSICGAQAGMGSAPSAIALAPTTMDTFYRTRGGELGADYWTASLGWHSVVLPGGADVAGDPAAVALGASDMDVFYRTPGGELGADYWTARLGWHTVVLPGGADVA